MSDGVANVLWGAGIICVVLGLFRPLRRPTKEASVTRRRWFTVGYALAVTGFVLVTAAFGHTSLGWW